jgi:hypothetical protein
MEFSLEVAAMDVAPVSGIRAVSPFKVQRADSALPPPFEIGASARTDDETYSAQRESPDPGREEEAAEFVDESWLHQRILRGAELRRHDQQHRLVT